MASEKFFEISQDGDADGAKDLLEKGASGTRQERIQKSIETRFSEQKKVRFLLTQEELDVLRRKVSDDGLDEKQAETEVVRTIAERMFFIKDMEALKASPSVQSVKNVLEDMSRVPDVAPFLAGSVHKILLEKGYSIGFGKTGEMVVEAGQDSTGLAASLRELLKGYPDLAPHFKTALILNSSQVDAFIVARTKADGSPRSKDALDTYEYVKFLKDQYGLGDDFSESDVADNKAIKAADRPLLTSFARIESRPFVWPWSDKKTAKFGANGAIADHVRLAREVARGADVAAQEMKAARTAAAAPSPVPPAVPAILPEPSKSSRQKAADFIRDPFSGIADAIQGGNMLQSLLMIGGLLYAAFSKDTRGYFWKTMLGLAVAKGTGLTDTFADKVENGEVQKMAEAATRKGKELAEAAKNKAEALVSAVAETPAARKLIAPQAEKLATDAKFQSLTVGQVAAAVKSGKRAELFVGTATGVEEYRRNQKSIDPILEKIAEGVDPASAAASQTVGERMESLRAARASASVGVGERALESGVTAADREAAKNGATAAIKGFKEAAAAAYNRFGTFTGDYSEKNVAAARVRLEAARAAAENAAARAAEVGELETARYVRLELARFYAAEGSDVNNAKNVNHVLSLGYSVSCLGAAADASGKPVAFPHQPGFTDVVAKLDVRSKTILRERVDQIRRSAPAMDEFTAMAQALENPDIKEMWGQAYAQTYEKYGEKMEKALASVDASKLSPNQKLALQSAKYSASYPNRSAFTKWETWANVGVVGASLAAFVAVEYASAGFATPFAATMLASAAGGLTQTAGSAWANDQDFLRGRTVGDFVLNSGGFVVGAAAMRVAGAIRASAGLGVESSFAKYTMTSRAGAAASAVEGGGMVAYNVGADVLVRQYLDGTKIDLGDSLKQNLVWALMPLGLYGFKGMRGNHVAPVSRARMELADQVATDLERAKLVDALGDHKEAQKILAELDKKIRENKGVVTIGDEQAARQGLLDLQDKSDDIFDGLVRADSALTGKSMDIAALKGDVVAIESDVVRLRGAFSDPAAVAKLDECTVAMATRDKNSGLAAKVDAFIAQAKGQKASLESEILRADPRNAALTGRLRAEIAAIDGQIAKKGGQLTRLRAKASAADVDASRLKAEIKTLSPAADADALFAKFDDLAAKRAELSAAEAKSTVLESEKLAAMKKWDDEGAPLGDAATQGESALNAMLPLKASAEQVNRRLELLNYVVPDLTVRIKAVKPGNDLAIGKVKVSKSATDGTYTVSVDGATVRSLKPSKFGKADYELMAADIVRNSTVREQLEFQLAEKAKGLGMTDAAGVRAKLKGQQFEAAGEKFMIEDISDPAAPKISKLDKAGNATPLAPADAAKAMAALEDHSLRYFTSLSDKFLEKIKGNATKLDLSEGEIARLVRECPALPEWTAKVGKKISDWTVGDLVKLYEDKARHNAKDVGAFLIRNGFWWGVVPAIASAGVDYSNGDNLAFVLAKNFTLYSLMNSKVGLAFDVVPRLIAPLVG